MVHALHAEVLQLRKMQTELQMRLVESLEAIHRVAAEDMARLERRVEQVERRALELPEEEAPLPRLTEFLSAAESREVASCWSAPSSPGTSPASPPALVLPTRPRSLVAVVAGAVEVVGESSQVPARETLRSSLGRRLTPVRIDPLVAEAAVRSVDAEADRRPPRRRSVDSEAAPPPAAEDPARSPRSPRSPVAFAADDEVVGETARSGRRGSRSPRSPVSFAAEDEVIELARGARGALRSPRGRRNTPVFTQQSFERMMSQTEPGNQPAKQPGQKGNACRRRRTQSPAPDAEDTDGGSETPVLVSRDADEWGREWARRAGSSPLHGFSGHAATLEQTP